MPAKHGKVVLDEIPGFVSFHHLQPAMNKGSVLIAMVEMIDKEWNRNGETKQGAKWQCWSFERRWSVLSTKALWTHGVCCSAAWL